MDAAIWTFRAATTSLSPSSYWARKSLARPTLERAISILLCPSSKRKRLRSLLCPPVLRAEFDWQSRATLLKAQLHYNEKADLRAG